MTDGDVTDTGVIYPPPNATLAKSWEPACLNACSSKKLLAIAGEYDLSGYSRLHKEELFRFIYDHMLTKQECTVCEGQCRPNTHLFQPHEAVPTSVSQSGVPPELLSPGQRGPGTSPNFRVRQSDVSPDIPLGGGGGFHPLYPGQPDPSQQSASTHQQSIVENIQIGARVNDETFNEPEGLSDLDNSLNLDDTVTDAFTRSTLRAEAEKFQAELDSIEKGDDDRRRARVEKAKQAASAGPTLAQQIEKQRAAQREAMKKRNEEKDAAARAEIQKLKSAPRPHPSRRSSAPVSAPAPTSGTRFNMDDVDAAFTQTERGSHSRDAKDVFDEEALTKKNLVDYMSISMVKALEAMEASKRRSMPLGAADPNSFNGVPDGAPNTGKLALKAVSNRFMAERFGLAPTPNLSIEGDLTHKSCIST